MNYMSSKDQLIIPVYLNEKIVLDMLAIMEDGFSMVSEISSSNQNIQSSNTKLSGGISTKAILDKLLKIQLDGSLQKEKSDSTLSETKLERVHTNVSLLSKFRTRLINDDILACRAGGVLDFTKIETGDFIELEGELQKNPMIDIMEKFIKVFKMAEIFVEEPELGNKKVVYAQEQYMSNDNISEILGGTFKILGKVIKV